MRMADANSAVEKGLLVNYTVTRSGIPELKKSVKKLSYEL